MPMQLAELGERICIMGPSNSGKSTLADAIARKRGLPAVHLDQLYHRPHTDWQPRPFEEFVALHDEAIAAARWVIDGNYTRCLPQRLQRATGLILLDVPVSLSLLRYVRRTLSGAGRVGAIAGGRDSIKWDMLHHIAVVTPGNRKRYLAIYRDTGLPKLHLPSARDIEACYRQWQLER
ncbi:MULTISPECIES: AAA family ATPase [unclassified Dyella]|uniref:AAA family ATPase n=1 Tax=unclassified Dyella TaxID=2634549 RepID=UPI0020329FDC|nr:MULTISPECIES: AAA family ATPase [unclassified Dyella]